jgi:hypothetical protein
MNETAMSAMEEVGDSFVPFGLHAGRAGGFHTQAPAVKLLAGAV